MRFRQFFDKFSFLKVRSSPNYLVMFAMGLQAKRERAMIEEQRKKNKNSAQQKFSSSQQQNAVQASAFSKSDAYSAGNTPSKFNFMLLYFNLLWIINTYRSVNNTPNVIKRSITHLERQKDRASRRRSFSGDNAYTGTKYYQLYDAARKVCKNCHKCTIGTTPSKKSSAARRRKKVSAHATNVTKDPASTSAIETFSPEHESNVEKAKILLS